MIVKYITFQFIDNTNCIDRFVPPHIHDNECVNNGAKRAVWKCIPKCKQILQKLSFSRDVSKFSDSFLTDYLLGLNTMSWCDRKIPIPGNQTTSKNNISKKQQKDDDDYIYIRCIRVYFYLSYFEQATLSVSLILCFKEETAALILIILVIELL